MSPCGKCSMIDFPGTSFTQKGSYFRVAYACNINIVATGAVYPEFFCIEVFSDLALRCQGVLQGLNCVPFVCLCGALGSLCDVIC